MNIFLWEKRCLCSVPGFSMRVEQKLAHWLTQCCWRTHRCRRPGSPLHFTSQLLSWWDLRSHFTTQFMFDDFIDFPFPSPLCPSFHRSLFISLASFLPLLCHSLLTQVHLQLHTPSCLLPSLQPSARCYWIPFSNSENKSDKNWRPFLFITIYHNTVLWLNLLPLFDLLKICLHNVEGKVIKWHCTSIQLKSLVQSISFCLPAADMDAFLSERFVVSVETHIWNAGNIKC